MEAIQSELETLKAEKLEKENQEAFNTRMASMDEAYELNDEDREVIASDIKELNEEDFEAYSKKMAVLLSAKNRKAIAEEASKNAEKEAQAASETEEESRTEATTEDVVAEVLEETEVKAEVPVSTAANEPTVYDKYKAAFDMDGFDFKHR
jgi:formylmethanofuran dehydrogenase subunit A